MQGPFSRQQSAFENQNASLCFLSAEPPGSAGALLGIHGAAQVQAPGPTRRDHLAAGELGLLPLSVFSEPMCIPRIRNPDRPPQRALLRVSNEPESVCEQKTQVLVSSSNSSNSSNRTDGRMDLVVTLFPQILYMK